MAEVLAGTADGLHEIGNGQEVQIAGREVSALAVGEAERWAIVDGHEVWRSEANGDWGMVAAVDALRANCILPSPAGPLVGMSGARLFALHGNALEPVAPFDETAGRDSWYTPWRGPPDVRSMSGDPAGRVYVNVHVGGVARSNDGGASWEPTIDIHSDVHQVLFDRGSGLVLTASARGLGTSDDGGGSWRFDTEGLHGSYLRAVCVAGGTVLVTASTGHSSDRAAVYRRPLAGRGPFERCEEGLPEWFPSNVDTYCLAAEGSRVAFGTGEGSVYVSADEGERWEAAAERLPPVRCVAIG